MLLCNPLPRSLRFLIPSRSDFLNKIWPEWHDTSQLGLGVHAPSGPKGLWTVWWRRAKCFQPLPWACVTVLQDRWSAAGLRVGKILLAKYKAGDSLQHGNPSEPSRRLICDDMAKEKDINVTTAEAQSWESVEAREAAQAAQDQQQHVYNQAQPLTEKWWVWELFACFVCTAAFLGMVGFLAPYDQKPVPNWVLAQNFKGHTLGFSVSINSILSIFSTIVKSSLLIPVAAGISQLKWLWFSDGHKLSDFQLFEAAKGGPLGSILILWNMRGR